MKYLLLLLAMLSTAFAVEDDGNPATRRARFLWEQTPPDPIITKYFVYYWKDGQTRADAVRVELPSPPQAGETLAVSVIVDGFEQGQKYHAVFCAANDIDESADSDMVSFTMPKYLPVPRLPKVEIQVSKDLSTWRTIAFIPLDEVHQYVRVKIEPPEAP